MKKFVDNKVFEPLIRPKGLTHLLRYAPLFLIPKKQTGEGPTKYWMIADKAKNGRKLPTSEAAGILPSKRIRLGKMPHAKPAPLGE